MKIRYIMTEPTFNEYWYSESQGEFLAELVNRVTELSGNIIEIGCWEGKSTSYIANACWPEKVISNDTWLGNVQESAASNATHVSETIASTRDVYATFVRNMDALTRGNYTVVKQDCFEWLATYAGPIKFIHIDASHDYESVRRTIEMVLPHMVSGGIVCGDDFISAHMGRADLQGGVERAVREHLPGFTANSNLWYWVNV